MDSLPALLPDLLHRVLERTLVARRRQRWHLAVPPGVGDQPDAAASPYGDDDLPC
jgi:hypothetical protein